MYMEYKEKEDLVLIRFSKGEDLIGSLNKVCNSLSGDTFAVVTGLGQVEAVEVGFFVTKGDYSPEVLEGKFEVLGLSGIISRGEEGNDSHLHIILGDMDKKALGGHLFKATVSATAEIVLRKVGIPIRRVLNEETGIREMRIG